jgi:hypothetical protein
VFFRVIQKARRWTKSKSHVRFNFAINKLLMHLLEKIESNEKDLEEHQEAQ